MIELEIKKALKCWNKSKLAMSDEPILITSTHFIHNISYLLNKNLFIQQNLLILIKFQQRGIYGTVSENLFK